MTSQYNTSSWRDDFDLEPNTHPTIAFALQALRPPPVWPFPPELIPVDKRTPPPKHPDAEAAPW